MRGPSTGLAVLALATNLACARPEPAPPTAPAPAPAALPPELVRDLADRQRCNLLNGCAPEDALVALGPAYVRAACELYAGSAAGDDRYWRSRVLAALGRLGGPDAVLCLRGALRDGRWLEKATAAFALGHLRAAEALPDLQAVLTRGPGPGGLALEAGVRTALTQLGQPVDMAPLWSHLANAASELDQWTMLRFVVQAARELGAREQAPAIARLLKHPDYYLRREALQALAVLGDASTVDVVAAALDDPMPGIRRAAAATLGALVPGAGAGSVEAWRTWRDSRAGRTP